MTHAGWTRAYTAIFIAAVSLPFLSSPHPAQAQINAPVTNNPPFYGPYNATFLLDGEGLKKPLLENDTVLRATSPWTLSCWVKPAAAIVAPTLVAGLGEVTEEYPLSKTSSPLNAADGSRILPAYYSGNYLSLLPGESRDIEIQYPASAAKGASRVQIRGWNAPSETVAVTAE